MTKEEKWVLEEKYVGDPKAPGFEEDKRRLARGEPAAYVIGHQPFLGLKIYLDSRPLIPRPETEWWTEQLLREAEAIFCATGCPKAEPGPEGVKKSLPRASFLDLCAGSGAIGCAALKAFPNAHIFFGELDPTHEATIRKNICENRLDESRADIRIGDLFAPFRYFKFDVIAANPPYIPKGRELPASVKDFEPRLALLAGADGLAIIRRIAAELPEHMNPGGTAWIECDSDHAQEAKALFEDQRLPVEIRTDQFGQPRLLVVSF